VTVFPVGRATRFTLRESVIDRVRGCVVDGTLRGGTHLAEVELSESLGVSRATLREALRQLQQEGILVQDERGRVFVREVTAQEVRDIFEVRTGLEQVAVRRLCALPDRAVVVAELRAKLERLRHPVSLADDVEADLAFHDAICALAGNPTLQRAWADISGLIRITMISAGPGPARENMAYDRHRPIVDLVEAGDAEAARRFIETHMATAAELLVARMEQH
jgi:DNA-binding GntR family transcriptional regulator